MKTALLPNVLVSAVATYGRPPVWHDLTVLVPPCPDGCWCPRHWPQVDPWHGAPLLHPRRQLGVNR